VSPDAVSDVQKCSKMCLQLGFHPRPCSYFLFDNLWFWRSLENSAIFFSYFV